MFTHIASISVPMLSDLEIVNGIEVADSEKIPNSLEFVISQMRNSLSNGMKCSSELIHNGLFI